MNVPARLNQQNLEKGLGEMDNRRSFGGINSEIGSIYKGGGDDDALSHFMVGSEAAHDLGHGGISYGGNAGLG